MRDVDINRSKNEHFLLLEIELHIVGCVRITNYTL